MQLAGRSFWFSNRNSEWRSERQPRRMNEASHIDILGSSFPGKGICKCKGPIWEWAWSAWELARRLGMLKQDERGIEDESSRRLVREVLLLLLLLSCFSRVWLCENPWTAAHQAPPSMGFSRQEYWSGLPLPSPSQRASRGQTDILCTVRRAYKTLLSCDPTSGIYYTVQFSHGYMTFMCLLLTVA